MKTEKVTEVAQLIKSSDHIVLYIDSGNNHELNRIIFDNDEAKAFFRYDTLGRYIDLFNVHINEIFVFKETDDWKNWSPKDGNW